MPVTDPVADMLTRIRNAQIAKHDTVEVPSSNMKKAIAEILMTEGFIKGCEYIDDGVQGTLKIKLKYGPQGERVIRGLKKICLSARYGGTWSRPLMKPHRTPQNSIKLSLATGNRRRKR